MERPDGSLTIRIVCLVLIGFGTSQCDQLTYSSLTLNRLASSNNKVDAIKTNCLSVSPELVDQSCRYLTDECHFQQGNLTCRQVSKLNATFLSSCSCRIVYLDIIEGQFSSIDESGLLKEKYPALRRLSIRNSSLEKAYSLPVSHQLIEIHFVNNPQLNYLGIDDSTLKRLQVLNLANNNLSSIPDLSIASNLSRLDLSGNQWDCRDDFQWVLQFHESGVLHDGDNLICEDTSKEGSWINWSYSLIRQETNKRTVDAECRNRTAGCSCRFASRGLEGRTSYTVQVDCSNKNLTSLPKDLPNFTNELDVSGNYLTTLDQVIRYRNHTLKTLIADSNQIESIRNLSRSDFIQNFSLFSLKHNRINPTEIPLEELVRVPDQFQAKYVYLYNNSWECDCNMATNVRNWLWRNHHVVNDSSLLLCSRDGRKIPVMYLLPQAVCPSRLGQYDPDNATSQDALAEINENRIYFLHTIIYLEVSLIVVLGLKLAYDSWNYFRHGQLPWIATKLL